MRVLHRVAAAVLVAPLALPAAEAETPVHLRLEEQANAIWSGLPESADDGRVRLLGATTRACAAEALRQARTLLAAEPHGRVALRSLSLAEPPPGTAARSEQVLQPLADGGCGDGGAFYDITAAAGGPARFHLNLLLEGGCGCAAASATSGLRRFRLAGRAALEPGLLERKGVQRLRIGEPRYEVLATCGPCEERSTARAVEVAKADPCDAPCASLTRGLAAWQREATEATAKLAELAGKATTIELDVTSDRRALESAQATPRRTRAVLEQISKLQDRIKAAQAELAKVARASQEIQKHLAALQRAGADTQAAGDRCQSQCRLRQQRQQRSPGQTASTGSPAGGGGGIPGTALIAGTAAVAAGGIAIVAAQGGGEDQRTPTFPGTWAGTRTTTTRIPALCTRVYNETWNIQQSGTTLRADITATAQSCGTAGCGQNCTIFAFPREHPGSVSGDTALFYVFPGLQVPSCVLPLRLQGDTLSGTMPACDTGTTDVLTDVVTLRRTGR